MAKPMAMIAFLTLPTVVMIDGKVIFLNSVEGDNFHAINMCNQIAEIGAIGKLFIFYFRISRRPEQRMRIITWAIPAPENRNAHVRGWSGRRR